MITLTTDEIALIITALEYFQRDIDDGEELTAGGEPVATEEIDALVRRLEGIRS